MKKNLLLIGLIVISISALGKNNVRINGEILGIKNISHVEAFLPIGRLANHRYANNYPVKENKFNIIFKIIAPTFIKIKVGTEPVTLIVKPGDDISFKIYNGKDRYELLKFKGANAAGQYWYNIYNYLPSQNFDGHAELITLIAKKDAKEGLRLLNSFLTQQTYPLDSLFRLKQIDKAFLLLAKQDIRDMHISYIESTLSRISEKNKELTNNFQYIIAGLDKYAAPNSINHVSSYFGDVYQMGYYGRISKIPDNKSKISSGKFGPYNIYLLAPDVVRSYSLGNILVFQLINHSNEYNFNDAYKYYKYKYPNSPFISVINKLIKVDNNKTIGKNNSNAFVDTLSNFNSFNDIAQKFNSENIYIDLWATWCIPCMKEFPYYTSIDPKLQQYGLHKVFISIDDSLYREKWLRVIHENALDGYHILANKTLQNDLKRLAYNNGQVSIPRYIILKSGKVVTWDAPRPSDPKLISLIQSF